MNRVARRRLFVRSVFLRPAKHEYQQARIKHTYSGGKTGSNIPFSLAKDGGVNGEHDGLVAKLVNLTDDPLRLLAVFVDIEL